LFLLAASPAGAGSTVLTWAAPTTNVDGSELTDLIGFNVYHGTSPTAMMMAVTLAATARTYVEANLTPAVWYWYVTAVNAMGTESVPSAMVTKTIAPPAPPVVVTPAPPATITPVPPAAAVSAAGLAHVPASTLDADDELAGAAGSDDAADGSAAPPVNPRWSARWSQSRHRTLCRPWGTVGCAR
jgi:hypothetical protein